MLSNRGTTAGLIDRTPTAANRIPPENRVGLLGKRLSHSHALIVQSSHRIIDSQRQKRIANYLTSR